MNASDAFLELLRRDGVVRTPDARLTPLTGGVSCDIHLVEDGPEQFVVKRARAKLNVAADWFADVNRNRSEWEFIRYVARFNPSAVPALRHCSGTGNYFAMEYLGAGFQNWKKLLLVGEANPDHAQWAGHLLGEIHQSSAGDAEARELFDTTRNFFQLRIEPYLLTTGAKHPALRPFFEAEAARLEATRECLVHGDFSPKNILITANRMVLLDCEVAWYGDPAFDAAFLLTHFFLKGLLPQPSGTHMKRMFGSFWTAYLATRRIPELEPRVGRLLLMLMLARVDGKSPVEYLDAARQNTVRVFVQRELLAENFSLFALADLWFDPLHALHQ